MSQGLTLRGRPLAGRRVTVLGLGLLGGGAEVARALVACGARVTASDIRSAEALRPTVEALAGTGVELALGGHRREDLDTDVVVVNPAVPPSSPAVAIARAAGSTLTSEIELLLGNVRGAVIAVTGTQGKSSTCHLLAQLLTAAGGHRRVHLGGNIGRALIGSLASIEADDAVVLELSSYQLEGLPPDVRALGLQERVAAGCVTNVLADHLERHGSLEAYAAAKRRLLELLPAGAPVVVPADDERVASWDVEALDARRFALCPPTHSTVLGLERGCFVSLAGRDGEGAELGRVADLALPGRFQRANALAALGLAQALGAAPQALGRALGGCKGLPHRLEDLGHHGGHRVFDNGISTTPDSTAAALDALAERGAPVTLLVGGQAKELPLAPLVEAARGRVRAAFAFGASGARLAEALRAGGVQVEARPSLEEAVRAAFADMPAGETLLFSPACASFDAYLNFADRAAAFRAALPPPTG